MINAVLEFVSACPLIEGKRVMLNYLDDGIGAYALENVSDAYTVKEYTDGERLCAVRFVFAARRAITLSKHENAAVVDFYEGFCRWLEEGTINNQLPQLMRGRRAVSILPCGSYFVKSTSGTAARYELMIELRYLESL